MRLNDFSACIVVDGSVLQEYNVEYSSDRKKATCWIASEEGKNFSVEWKCWSLVRSATTAGHVFVDGFECKGRCIEPGRLGRNDHAERSYVSISNTARRPFLFSPLQLTDDDSYLEQSTSEHLGEITLTIWRVRMVKCVERKSTFNAIPDTLVVHERSKKGSTHRVGFGDVVYTPFKKEKRGMKRIDTEPRATFTFRYRAPKILQAMGIAPLKENDKSSVSPAEEIEVISPISTENSSATVGAEIKYLEEKLHRLRSQRKRSASHEIDVKPKRVKKEDSVLRSKAMFIPGEIIDLT